MFERQNRLEEDCGALLPEDDALTVKTFEALDEVGAGSEDVPDDDDDAEGGPCDSTLLADWSRLL